jgi:iron(III) transport system permease protein
VIAAVDHIARARIAGSTMRLESVLRVGAGMILLGVMAVLIVMPLYALLSQSLEDADKHFVGIDNFIRYARNPGLVQSVYNSLFVSVIVTVITIPLAFAYAYALMRSCIPAKAVFKGIALLPILAPSLLPAISLTYMFGNQGFIRGLLAGQPIYGPIGIVMAQVFHCFPFGVLILTTALGISDARLYEVAETLSASKWRMFWTITFPAARYGLISACFVIFTTAIVDFGIAKVIGGSYNVLAIEVYKQIIGQQNFQMGAVIGVLLLVPALVTFAIERHANKRQISQLTVRAVLYRPRPDRTFDLTMLAFVLVVALCILGVNGVAIFASFVKLWPYDLSFSLGSYDFPAFDPGGWSSYWNSLIMASLAALFGTILTFSGAYLVEKTPISPILRNPLHMLAMIPIAVPGIVLGLGYVFFFNAPNNPLGFVYYTMTILVLCSIAHYYTVPYLTAVTALKQVDREFESASQALGVPFWVTLRRVTIPISIPVILDIATYIFVNAMTTVAAVIFIYSPENKLASIAVIAMEDTGDLGAACAMAMMILYTSIAVKLAQTLLSKLLFVKLQQWRQPTAA